VVCSVFATCASNVCELVLQIRPSSAGSLYRLQCSFHDLAGHAVAPLQELAKGSRHVDLIELYYSLQSAQSSFFFLKSPNRPSTSTVEASNSSTNFKLRKRHRCPISYSRVRALPAALQNWVEPANPNRCAGARHRTPCARARGRATELAVNLLGIRRTPHFGRAGRRQLWPPQREPQRPGMQVLGPPPREMERKGGEEFEDESGNMTASRARSTGGCDTGKRPSGSAEHASRHEREEGTCPGGAIAKVNRSTHNGDSAGEGRKRRADEESENSESFKKMEQEHRQLPRQPPLGVIRQLCLEAASCRQAASWRAVANLP